LGALKSIDEHFESEARRKGAFRRVVSDWHRVPHADPWRGSLRECVLGVGSQISGHAVCIVIALANAVGGSITAATGHDMTLSLLVGTAIYAAAVVARYLCSRSCHLPSFKTVILSLALGLSVSACVGQTLAYGHRQVATDWYQALSDAERRHIRGKVRIWMDKQSVSLHTSLVEAAQLTGYEFAEDYVIVSFCTPLNRELMAITDAARRGRASQPWQ
jgi:hypothetical protein